MLTVVQSILLPNSDNYIKVECFYRCKLLFKKHIYSESLVYLHQKLRVSTFKGIIYLFGRQSDTHTQRPSICWIPLKMPKIVGSGPGQSHEQGTQFWYPKWVAGAQAVGHLLLPCQSHYQEPIAGTWAGTQIRDASITSSGLTCCIAVLASD